eukprot:CAMPEP_0184492106 /NCGR_PEP_ID=MMETSP0113_2-20130426/22325_1 /TAXON_ID=91329 /ORGANISM="Norrisiella sphaerica, Strain BC52" /LENGTH=103 /DNA_ID=CAMNT_0026876757 /DNA_START=140 /DNA_END=448 /DNA_ORIENTATION=+
MRELMRITVKNSMSVCQWRRLLAATGPLQPRPQQSVLPSPLPAPLLVANGTARPPKLWLGRTKLLAVPPPSVVPLFCSFGFELCTVVTMSLVRGKCAISTEVT